MILLLQITTIEEDNKYEFNIFLEVESMAYLVDVNPLMKYYRYVVRNISYVSPNNVASSDVRKLQILNKPIPK